jgi:branched-subunit amino acid transport protein
MPVKEEFRTVNQILGTRPSLGPIPADQFIPWVGFMILTLVITQVLLPAIGVDIGWTWSALMAAWLCSTWYVLTYKRSWTYMGKFINRPQWCLGYQRYQPLTATSIQTTEMKNVQQQ